MQKTDCKMGCELCDAYEFREMDFRRSKKNCGCLSFFKGRNDNYYDSDTSSGSKTPDLGLKSNSKCDNKSKLKSMKGKLHIPFPSKLLSFLKREDTISMTKAERTMKAALLIQKWYRRYLARMEVRRRSTWTIFQSIEYAGEQDQLKLYTFFNALLSHIYDATTVKGKLSASGSRTSSPESPLLESGTKPEYEDEDLHSDQEYRGIHINLPPTKENLYDLIDTYRRSRYHRLHPRYVVGLLKGAVRSLKKHSNLNQASTTISKQVTICGDLHGNLDDLLVVFHKNDLPSTENPYIFNGDFVDRGKKSLEVLLILLTCLQIFPGGVYLNRGNHEDLIMNARYGFLKELQRKYPNNYDRLIILIEDVYRWLPLGTVVNNKVLVVHGGISDTTDLDMIRSLDRGKYLSLLRPPIPKDSTTTNIECIDKVEWKQVFDILWSDPQTNNGCFANKLRGAGTYFGPDVTDKFLEKNRMIFIVRSHECKADGYEIIHNGKVITVFSASNYYEVGSNRGAYVKLVGSRLDPHFVQYTTEKSSNFTFRERVGLVESSAIRELWRHIFKHKQTLSEEFNRTDDHRTGLIEVREWCHIMEKVINLNLPWRLLRDKLVTLDPDTQKVWYESTFDGLNEDLFKKKDDFTTPVVETLYRLRSNLETIFRIIDKDNSGFISLEEFSDACNLINKHMPNPITRDQMEEICNLMDINKDGVVDLNEFLETFRMVDPEQNKKLDEDQLNRILPPNFSQPSNNKQNSPFNSLQKATIPKCSSVFGSPILNANTTHIELEDNSKSKIINSPDITKPILENRNITVTINRTSPTFPRITESPVRSSRSFNK